MGWGRELKIAVKGGGKRVSIGRKWCAGCKLQRRLRGTTQKSPGTNSRIYHSICSYPLYPFLPLILLFPSPHTLPFFPSFPSLSSRLAPFFKDATLTLLTLLISPSPLPCTHTPLSFPSHSSFLSFLPLSRITSPLLCVPFFF